VISSMLFICACWLMCLALKSELDFKRLLTGENWGVFRRRLLSFLLVVGWLGFYIFVLLERFSYSSATCVFLFVFMALFHVKEQRRVTVKHGATLFLIAFLMSRFLLFMFRDVARIPMP
jgi:hypothetical protein